MTSKNKTLDLYLEADEDKRLGLFLIHRDLREEFAKIERAEVEIVEDKRIASPAIRVSAPGRKPSGHGQGEEFLCPWRNWFDSVGRGRAGGKYRDHIYRKLVLYSAGTKFSRNCP